MRVNTISTNLVSNTQKKISQKASVPTVSAKNLTALGTGIAAASGMYIANKGGNIFLNQLKVNEQTKDTISNLKNDDSKQIFDLKTSKALLEASKLKDTTFFTNTMRNIDNIKEFKKLGDEFSMSAKSENGTINSKLTIKPNGTIITETTTQNEDETTTVRRVNNGNTIEEKLSKTINDKKVLEETTKYNIKKPSIERVTFDNNNKNQREKYSKITFSKDGVIKDKITASSVFKDGGKVSTQYLGMSFKNNSKITATKNGKEFDTYFENYLYNDLEKITKTYINPKTGKSETYVLEKSQVPDVYNSYTIDDRGSIKPESIATQDKNGNIKIRKNLVSLDGTTTKYEYNSSSDNNIKMHYQVIDSKGNVLTTVDRTFNRINENLAYSSVNGHKYKIETTSDAFYVTDELSGKKTEIKRDETLFWDKDTHSNHDLLHKLSGDMLLDLHDRNYKYQYNGSEGGCAEPFDRRIYSPDSVYLFAHEQGHSKDFAGPADIDYDEEIERQSSTGQQHRFTNNPVFRKPYEEERAAFINAFSETEMSYINYFIDRLNHYRGFSGSAAEMLANTNAMTSTGLPSTHDNVAYHYLQKYFPRTIAAAQALLNPNSNIQVGM